MTTKMFLTIAAIVGILYGLAFVLFPGPFIALFGSPPEPHAIVNAQFFGSALIGIGVVGWFARDFRDASAVRGVLIALVATTVVGGLVAIGGVLSGAINALGWTSVLVYVLLLAGSLYCLSMGEARKA
jgi:Na+-driven multidrug efflux pump